MAESTGASDWAVGAGTAFVAAAGLLIALHGGAEGKGAGVAASAPSAEARLGVVEVRRTVHLMGTRLEGIAWSRDREAGLATLEAAFEEVEREEALLSTWREGTPLARLNAAAPGEAVEVSARLGGLLEEARRIARATGGAFDPAVGSLVDAWDLRGEGRRPSEGELASARRASGLGCFEPGPGRRVTPRCPGAWIDAGAFGKGSALRRAGEELGVGSDAPTATLLDFGGQLLAVGAPPGREAWPAAVAHPARRDRPVAELRLRDRSAATTSASERFVTIDGRVRGHVLDPRTGRPAPAWGSATVVAEDPLRTDALSTALFVMGPEEGWRWARGRDDVGVLLLTLDERPDAGPARGAAGGPGHGAPREDGEPPDEDAAAKGAAAPGVAACWNAAMERWLAEAPGPRRCPDAATTDGSRAHGSTADGSAADASTPDRGTKRERGSTKQEHGSQETRTEARRETSGG